MEHPITPPPELVQQWLGKYFGCTVSGELSESERYLATASARWGADQELQECCHLLWLQGFDVIDDLRAARRPKPPSLKEQALLAIDVAVADGRLSPDVSNVVRRALEQLND